MTGSASGLRDMASSLVGPLDVAVIGAYFALTLGAAFWFSRRKIRTSEELFLADRQATWPMIGASLFSANISSQQFVGQAGLAYMIGIAAGAFQMVGAMCFVFLALYFVDVYLKLRLRTAPEFFERRYNRGSRVFVAGINIVMILAANIMAALYAGATVVTDLAGWTSSLGFGAAIAVIGAAAGVYTIAGGLRTILWLDLFQATVLVLGGAVTLVVGIRHAGGIASLLGAHDTIGGNAWSLVQPWDHAYGWLPMITGAVILGVHGHCTDHDYIQRVLAARDVFHAKMGALFGSLLKIVALFIIAAPGVVAAKLIPGLAEPDQAYSRLVVGYVPTGLLGVVLAGLLAAIMGSVAAGLAAASSMLMYDFVQRLRPALSESSRVRLGRITMAGMLIGCALLAPLIKNFQGLFGYLVRLWSLLAPPVFVCVVFGIFSRRASSRGAIATLTVGTVLGVMAFYALGQPAVVDWLPRYLRSSLNIGFLITAVCAVVMAMLPERQDRRPHPADTGVAAPPLPMRASQRVVYRIALAVLAILWLTVLAIFSPLGVGGRQ